MIVADLDRDRIAGQCGRFALRLADLALSHQLCTDRHTLQIAERVDAVLDLPHLPRQAEQRFSGQIPCFGQTLHQVSALLRDRVQRVDQVRRRPAGKARRHQRIRHRHGQDFGGLCRFRTALIAVSEPEVIGLAGREAAHIAGAGARRFAVDQQIIGLAVRDAGIDQQRGNARIFHRRPGDRYARNGGAGRAREGGRRDRHIGGHRHGFIRTDLRDDQRLAGAAVRAQRGDFHIIGAARLAGRQRHYARIGVQIGQRLEPVVRARLRRLAPAHAEAFQIVRPGVGHCEADEDPVGRDGDCRQGRCGRRLHARQGDAGIEGRHLALVGQEALRRIGHRLDLRAEIPARPDPLDQDLGGFLAELTEGDELAQGGCFVRIHRFGQGQHIGRARYGGQLQRARNRHAEGSRPAARLCHLPPADAIGLARLHHQTALGQVGFFVQNDAGDIARFVGDQFFNPAGSQPDQHHIMGNRRQVADMADKAFDIDIEFEDFGLVQRGVEPEARQLPDLIRIGDAGDLELFIKRGRHRAGRAAAILAQLGIPVGKDEHFVRPIALILIDEGHAQAVHFAREGLAETKPARRSRGEQLALALGSFAIDDDRQLAIDLHRPGAGRGAHLACRLAA